MKIHLNNFLPIKIIISILFTIPLTVTALIQAQTSKHIIGHAPSLNETLLSEIKNKEFSLLGFKYNDIIYNNKNKYIKEFNPTIITPKELYDQLEPLLVTALEPGDAIDKDGDRSFSLSDTKLVIQIQDAKNTNISEETLNFCELGSKYSAPYHISVSADLLLKTQYGVPNSQSYTKTEGLKQQPQNNFLLHGACYAQPELRAGNPGPSNLWVAEKGFLVQSTTDYTQNFPSVGFDGAEFMLKVYGIDARTQEWQILSDTAGSNISASAMATDANTVTITLKGPIADTSNSRVGFSGPSQFRLKNITTDTIFYGFNINRWFITTFKQDIFSEIKTYCEAGGNYRLPDVGEITTAETLNTEITTRKMGALQGEWGNVTLYAKSQFYKWADQKPFWSREEATGSNYYMVMAEDGRMGYNDTGDLRRTYGKLCISN